MSKARPPSPLWTKIILVLVVTAFYIPLFVMLLESFRQKGITDEWEFTFNWYRQLLQDENLMAALWRSFVIAINASFLSCILGTLCALSLLKYYSRFRFLLDYLMYISLVIPELVFALALLSWFSHIGVNLGYTTVIASHTTFCLAFVSMTVVARLRTLDKYLDEASHDLGANKYQTLFRVILPVLKPAIIAGFLLSFLLSFDDFLITFYTSGPGADTLPIKLYSSMKIGLTPKLHALSVLMLAMSSLLIYLISRIKGIRELF